MILGILFLFTLLIYTLLTLFFPTFYYNYQSKNLDRQAGKVVAAAQSNSETEFKQALNNFFKNTEITPIITDENNSLVYIPGVEVIESTAVHSYQTPVIRESTQEETTQIIQKIRFQNQELIFRYSPNIRTITDSTQVLIQFAPYFLLFATLLSSLVAYIFSKKMVAPLKEMNQVAEEMVQLNFQNQVSVTSEDELGELSKNLNQLGKSLKEALNDLENKNALLVSDLEREREIEQLRKNFIMAISHELKSPIASAMGIVEAMESNIAPYDNHEEYLKKTYQILENMAALIQEMLEVSRLEQSFQVMKEQQINVTETLKKMVNTLQLQPVFKDREVLWDLEMDVVTQTTAQLFEKALHNIVSNAFQYSGEHGKIKISCKSLENGWYLSIFNTADYISNQELKRIFAPFYRLEKSGNKTTGGNGLGLFLTQQFLTTLQISYSFKNIENGVIFELSKNND
jgi:two-component system sensor histidine kinase VanS